MGNVYTVGQVNAYIKNMFAQDYMLRSIIVSGEVSNVKYHSSGHIYFTLKDNTGALSCVIYRWKAATIGFRLKDGDKVQVAGNVDVYEVKGEYQLVGNKITRAGLGELYERFERLKAELYERGMFDDMYKQDIPKYAKRIGIVTSSTGAVRRDIELTAKSRNPYVQLILYPAKVQGEGAKESIVAGIKTLENLDVDVIIVGRGGGSIEDLWPFNEECVAQAIFDCPIPIVSAVGHGTDVTIADFVADKSVVTPTAAAELTVFDYGDYLDTINDYSYHLTNSISNKIAYIRKDISQKEATIKAYSPASKVKLLKLKKEQMEAGLNNAMIQKLDGVKKKYEQIDLTTPIKSKIDRKKNKVLLDIERLKSLSPLIRLEQGFVSVSDKNGKRIKEIKGLKRGDEVKLALKDGQVEARVEKITPFDDLLGEVK